MQQACHRCGYNSDRPTRFCRQCGEQLFVENEATSASTRQYVPQQSANPYDAPYQSQLAQAQAPPNSGSNNQTPDTSRLYHPPAAQNYPNYPANYQPSESKKSGAWKWVLVTLLCLLLVSGGIGAIVISAIRAKRAAVEQERAKLLKKIESAKEAAQEAEDAGAPIPPLPPPPPSTSSEAGMDRYKYPNAELKKSVRIFGYEVTEMTTTDSVSKVRDYYKKKLGDPMIEGDDGDAVIFQISGSMIVIEHKESSDKTQITLFKNNM